MAFCFSGSLLRVNFSIVSLYFFLCGVIVSGKYIFRLSSLLHDTYCQPLTAQTDDPVLYMPSFKTPSGTPMIKNNKAIIKP